MHKERERERASKTSGVWFVYRIKPQSSEFIETVVAAAPSGDLFTESNQIHKHIIINQPESNHENKEKLKKPNNKKKI